MNSEEVGRPAEIDNETVKEIDENKPIRTRAESRALAPNEELEIIESLMKDWDTKATVALIGKKWWDSYKQYIGWGHEESGKYPRPGRIDNARLLEKGSNITLSRSVAEKIDFVFVSQKCWAQLIEWYGGGPAIIRRQIRDNETFDFKVRLWPLIINVKYYKVDGSVTKDSQLMHVDRNSGTLKSVYEEIRSRQSGEGGDSPFGRLRVPFRIIKDCFKGVEGKGKNAKKVCYVPDDFDENAPIEIPADHEIWDIHLQQLDFKDNDTFVIELQQLDSGWCSPMAESKFDMKNLSVGMHVQCMDKYNKEYHAMICGHRESKLDKEKEYLVRFLGYEPRFDEWVRESEAERLNKVEEDVNDTIKFHWQGKDNNIKKANSSSGGWWGNNRSTSYYSNEEGTPTAPGIVGLRNLGNTCFMNSIIQCVAQTPHLREYFIQDIFEHEINADNCLGKQGKVAKEWAQLLKDMWSGTYKTVVPNTFKTTIGQFESRFMGYNQQDSQEFLNFFLDGLHEDLNRVLQKPYVESKEADGRPDKTVAAESWDGHLQRNQSIITDLLHAQLKSKLVCPFCNRTSVTFDPFVFLSIPVPTDNFKTQIITFIPHDMKRGDPLTSYGIKIAKEVHVLNLKQKVKSSLERDVPTKYYHVGDVFSGTVYEKKDSDAVSDLKNPAENDDIFVYERVPFNSPKDPPEDYRERIRVFQIVNQANSSNGYSYYDSFALTMYVAADLNTEFTIDELKQQVVEKATLMMKEEVKEAGDEPENIEEHNEKNDDNDWVNVDEPGLDKNEKEEYPFKIKFTVKKANQYGYASSSEPQDIEDLSAEDIENLEKFIVQWDSKSYYNLQGFKFENRVHDESVPEQQSSMYRREPSKPIALQACLDAFTEEETLGEDNLWFCSECQKHVPATKRIDIWSANDVLVIHLKRFKQTRYSREKVDRIVEFPLEKLDLSPWICNPDLKGTDACLYDLFGISQHSGGLGGGHYTAVVKHIDDDQWYSCNDSWTEPVQNPEYHIKSDAYLLFYKRHKSLHGAEVLSSLMTQFNVQAANTENEVQSEPQEDPGSSFLGQSESSTDVKA